MNRFRIQDRHHYRALDPLWRPLWCVAVGDTRLLTPAASKEQATALCDRINYRLSRLGLPADWLAGLAPRAKVWHFSASQHAKKLAATKEIDPVEDLIGAVKMMLKDAGKFSLISAGPHDAAPTPADPAPLWCMHVLGPDDVYAMATQADAAATCAALNAEIAASGLVGAPGAPDIEAVVAQWPHSASSHADDLALGDSRYG